MKVVGLLSGGKDSCYNLIHCVQQGHELVALATLAPPGSKDELDSYMYQTVGHDAVHLVAEAMQLPLYRRVIKGTAINQRAEYGLRTTSLSSSIASSSTSKAGPLQDETEDLYHLLMDVKQHHPDVEAVSVGAILSNYQRVRVEHVAMRADVNLTPLTFLWQRSQSELYAEMLQAGLVSILIKVAGIGLDERDLGKTLGQIQRKLERLSAMYGAHVCGEGGEYETLTIDSPLFRKRIEVGDTETVIHSDGGGFGSVSYLRLKNAKLVEKEGHLDCKARTPPLLDVVGQRTLKTIQRSHASKAADLSNTIEHLQLHDALVDIPKPSIRRKGRYFGMSNVTGVTSSSTHTSVEDQVKNAFNTIKDLLTSSCKGLGMEHVTHINLYLGTQTLFGRINSMYRTMFGVSPPTRACVALASLPRGCDLMINAVAFDDTSATPPFDRRALHVQGRSFWAPANIGPYSQGIVQAEKIWISGQIGLLPADLSLPEDEHLQTALSIQHVSRIYKAMMNDMGGRHVDKGWVEGGLCWVDDEDMVEIARRAWISQCDGQDQEDEESEREEAKAWLGQPSTGESRLPPMLFVVLPRHCLPRSAAIEWQITAHTGRIPPSIKRDTANKTVTSSEDDDGSEPGSDTTHVSITRLSTIFADPDAPIEAVHTITTACSAQSSFGVLTLRCLPSSTHVLPDADSNHALTASIRTCTDQSYATQLFAPVGENQNQIAPALTLLKQLICQPSVDGASKESLLNASQVVACSSVHALASDTRAQQIDVAFVWHGI